jgi:membrane protease YdiL (CAAX protease family)
VFKRIKLIPSVSYLIKAPVYIFILAFFFPSVLLGAITTFLPIPDMAGSFATDSIVLDLLIAVILAPLIETLLFQSLIIEIICKIIKRPRKNICIALMVSSLAFAFNHTYSLGYFIITFFGGTILALAYYLGRYRKESAIILVYIIHAMYNLASSLYNMSLA